MPLFSRHMRRTPARARQRTTLCSRNRIPRTQLEYASIILQKISPFCRCSSPQSRRQQAAHAAGSSHRLPRRSARSATTPGRPGPAPVVPPIQQATRSAGGRAAATSWPPGHSARPPSRGRTGSRLNRHSTRLAPAASPGVRRTPPEPVRTDRLARGPRQHRRESPPDRRGRAADRRHLRPEDAEAQSRHPGPQAAAVPGRWPSSWTAAADRHHRQQLPPVHQCEPGRQQAEAAGDPNPPLRQ